MGRAAAKPKESSRLLSGRCCFLCFTLPSADNITGDREEVVRRDQGGGGDRGGLVNNCGLDQAFNALHSRGLFQQQLAHTQRWEGWQCAYINDAAQSTDSVRPVEHIATDSGVFHDNARRHDNILRSVGKLFQDKIYHLPQRWVFVLEQLRNTEKQRRRLVRGELLPGEKEDRNLGQKGTTLSRRDR